MDQRGDHCWHKHDHDDTFTGFLVTCYHCGVNGQVPGDGPNAAVFEPIPGHGRLAPGRLLVKGFVTLNNQRFAGKTCKELGGR